MRIDDKFLEEIDFEYGRMDVIANLIPHKYTVDAINKWKNIIVQLVSDEPTSVSVTHNSYGTTYHCPDCTYYSFSEFKYCPECGKHVTFT